MVPIGVPFAPQLPLGSTTQLLAGSQFYQIYLLGPTLPSSPTLAGAVLELECRLALYLLDWSWAPRPELDDRFHLPPPCWFAPGGWKRLTGLPGVCV